MAAGTTPVARSTTIAARMTIARSRHAERHRRRSGRDGRRRRAPRRPRCAPAACPSALRAAGCRPPAACRRARRAGHRRAARRARRGRRSGVAMPGNRCWPISGERGATRTSVTPLGADERAASRQRSTAPAAAREVARDPAAGWPGCARAGVAGRAATMASTVPRSRGMPDERELEVAERARPRHPPRRR